MVDMVNVVSATSGDFTRLLNFLLIITCFIKNAPQRPKQISVKDPNCKSATWKRRAGVVQASELASSPRWGRNAGRKENLGSRLTDLDFLAEGSAMLEMVLEGQSVPAEKYHMLLNEVIVVDTIT